MSVSRNLVVASRILGRSRRLRREAPQRHGSKSKINRPNSNNSNRNSNNNNNNRNERSSNQKNYSSQASNQIDLENESELRLPNPHFTPISRDFARLSFDVVPEKDLFVPQCGGYFEIYGVNYWDILQELTTVMTMAITVEDIMYTKLIHSKDLLPNFDSNLLQSSNFYLRIAHLNSKDLKPVTGSKYSRSGKLKETRLFIFLNWWKHRRGWVTEVKDKNVANEIELNKNMITRIKKITDKKTIKKIHYAINDHVSTVTGRKVGAPWADWDPKKMDELIEKWKQQKYGASNVRREATTVSSTQSTKSKTKHKTKTSTKEKQDKPKQRAGMRSRSQSKSSKTKHKTHSSTRTTQTTKTTSREKRSPTRSESNKTKKKRSGKKRAAIEAEISDHEDDQPVKKKKKSKSRKAKTAKHTSDTNKSDIPAHNTRRRSGKMQAAKKKKMLVRPASSSRKPESLRRPGTVLSKPPKSTRGITKSSKSSKKHVKNFIPSRPSVPVIANSSSSSSSSNSSSSSSSSSSSRSSSNTRSESVNSQASDNEDENEESESESMSDDDIKQSKRDKDEIDTDIEPTQSQSATQSQSISKSQSGTQSTSPDSSFRFTREQFDNAENSEASSLQGSDVEYVPKQESKKKRTKKKLKTKQKTQSKQSSSTKTKIKKKKKGVKQSNYDSLDSLSSSSEEEVQPEAFDVQENLDEWFDDDTHPFLTKTTVTTTMEPPLHYDKDANGNVIDEDKKHHICPIFRYSLPFHCAEGDYSSKSENKGWSSAKCRGWVILRKETAFDGSLKGRVLNFGSPYGSAPLRIELRDVNTTRAGTNTWIPRKLKGYWDQGEQRIDNDYNFNVWFETEWSTKYYTSLVQQKIKKFSKSPTRASGKRKIQIHPWEMMAIQSAIWYCSNDEFAMRRAYRQAAVDGGELDPPLSAIERALKKLKMSKAATKDLAIAIQQKYQSFRWSILLQFKENAIDYVKCKWKSKQIWRCKPSLLDITTERNGMADIDLNYSPFEPDDWIYPADIKAEMTKVINEQWLKMDEYQKNHPNCPYFSAEYFGFQSQKEYESYFGPYDWEHHVWDLDGTGIMTTDSDTDETQNVQEEVSDGIVSAPQDTRMQKLTSHQARIKTVKYLSKEIFVKNSEIISMINSAFQMLLFPLCRSPCTLISNETVLAAGAALDIDTDDVGLDCQLMLQFMFDYLQMGIAIDKNSLSSLCKYNYDTSILLKEIANRVIESSFPLFEQSWERIVYFTEILHEVNICNILLKSMRYALDEHHSDTNWCLYGTQILFNNFGFGEYCQNKKHLWTEKSNGNGIWDVIFHKDKNITSKGTNLVVLRQFRYVCAHIIGILTDTVKDQTGAIIIQSIHDLYEFSSNINWIELHEMIVGVQLFVAELENVPEPEYFQKLSNLIGTIARAVRDVTLLGCINIDKLQFEEELAIVEVWGILVVTAVTTIYEATLYLEKEYFTINHLYERLEVIHGIDDLMYTKHCQEWKYQFKAFKSYIGILTRRHCYNSTILFSESWNENNLKRSCYWQQFNPIIDRDDDSAWNRTPSIDIINAEDEWWALNSDAAIREWNLQYNTYDQEYCWTSGEVRPTEQKSIEIDIETEAGGEEVINQIENENDNEKNDDQENAQNDDQENEIEDAANDNQQNDNNEDTAALSPSIQQEAENPASSQSIQLNIQETGARETDNEEDVASESAQKPDVANANSENNEQKEKDKSNDNVKSKLSNDFINPAFTEQEGKKNFSNDCVQILFPQAFLEVPEEWIQPPLNHMWSWDDENKYFKKFKPKGNITVGAQGEFSQVTKGQTVYFRSSTTNARVAYIIDDIGEAQNDLCGAAEWTVHEKNNSNHSVTAVSYNFSKLEKPPFVFSSGNKLIAPKLGMTVKINKYCSQSNDDNPPHFDIFKQDWQLCQWYVDTNTGLWVADLITTSTQACDNSDIEMDVAITCPVFMLKHVSHHSGFLTIKFNQKDPDSMRNEWQWQSRVSASVENDLDANMDNQNKSDK